jgi:hypothetical protein
MSNPAPTPAELNGPVGRLRHPTGTVRFTVPLVIRLTPELDQLVRQGAAEEEKGIAEFVRGATIHRLGQLGLVPIVNDVDDVEDEVT